MGDERTTDERALGAPVVESIDYSNVSDEWCYHHGRIEPTKKGDYLACTECGHVYRTEDELRKEHFRRVHVGWFWYILLWPFWSTKFKNIELTITACPLCGYDF